MDERLLKRLCVAGSIMSLICIFILSYMVQPTETELCSLSSSHVGKMVSVSGTVGRVTVSEGNFFFVLSDGGCEVRAVMWKDTASAMAMRGEDPHIISENATVSISGNVEVRGGALQVVVSRPSVKS